MVAPQPRRLPSSYLHQYRLWQVHPISLRAREARRGSGNMAIAAPALTRRELEILTLSAQGKTAQQIGDSLGITKRTVDAHREAIIRKLGVSNITQAVSTAIAAHLVHLP